MNDHDLGRVLGYVWLALLVLCVLFSCGEHGSSCGPEIDHGDCAEMMLDGN